MPRYTRGHRECEGCFRGFSEELRRSIRKVPILPPDRRIHPHTHRGRGRVADPGWRMTVARGRMLVVMMILATMLSWQGGSSDQKYSKAPRPRKPCAKPSDLFVPKPPLFASLGRRQASMDSGSWTKRFASTPWQVRGCAPIGELRSLGTRVCGMHAGWSRTHRPIHQCHTQQSSHPWEREAGGTIYIYIHTWTIQGGAQWH